MRSSNAPVRFASILRYVVRGRCHNLVLKLTSSTFPIDITMLCPQQSPPATPGPHRALLCYDVLCTIFDQLAAPEDAWYDYDVSNRDAHCWYARRVDSQRRTTLARCARVCRAFFAPVTAILWRDVDSLTPLISALRTSDPSSLDVS